MHKRFACLVFIIVIFVFSCAKSNEAANESHPPDQTHLKIKEVKVDGESNGLTYYALNDRPIVKFYFTTQIEQPTAANSIVFKKKDGKKIPFNISFERDDSTIGIQPKTSLFPTSQYTVTVLTDLKAHNGLFLEKSIGVTLITAIDSTNNFPRISDSALLTLIQKQTFNYFWDFGDPVSGMARERNTSGDVITTGGSGFGIMAILVGVHRNFVSRTEGLDRIQKIVGFLKDKCTRYHGAFAHWINGTTGETVPFSKNDDGADLVETSFLMEGLLAARQFFDQNNAQEKQLKKDINALWDGVEWNWFRGPSPPAGGEKEGALYWHWSPDKDWVMNLPIKGWDEALMTYVLAASSNTHAIEKKVYDNG